MQTLGRYKFVAVVIFISFVTHLTSCDNDEQSKIFITGYVKYASDNSSGKGIPLTLKIIDNETNNTVLSEINKSDHEGLYKFEVNSTKLQKSNLQAYPYSYILGTASKSLVIIDHWNPCLSGNSNGIVPFSPVQNILQHDIVVDDVSYLEITFNKIDPFSTDEIGYNHCGLVLSPIGKSKWSQFLPYSYYNSFDIVYYILKDTGETLENQLSDVNLRKNDTTKVVIDY